MTTNTPAPSNQIPEFRRDSASRSAITSDGSERGDDVNRRRFISGTLAACMAGHTIASSAAEVGEARSDTMQPIAALAHRLIGHRAAELAFETISAENALDVFEVQSVGGQVTLRGNNTIAQAAALNCFLRECCQSQISWTGNQIHLPRRWNVPGGKIRRNSLFQYRYFLNYCTFSYTMAFWDFPRWQRELDWMALNGYDHGNLVLAWRKLLSTADHLGKISTYRFDLTDVTRQVLDDLGLWQYQRMTAALRTAHREEFARQSRLFLNMILDQDKLLGTQSGFLLGQWLAAAESLGNNAGEKACLQRNARTLITVWGPKPGLADYSAREWAGMLRHFYFQRWQLWIRQQSNILAGHTTPPINWFDWAQKWTHQQSQFPDAPTGDSIVEARRIKEKYTPMLKEAGYWR